MYDSAAFKFLRILRLDYFVPFKARCRILDIENLTLL